MGVVTASPAPEPTRQARYAAVLDEHRAWTPVGYWPEHPGCTCGWEGYDHRSHLAAALAAADTDEHCATCVCGRRAPVQGEYAHGERSAKAPGTISWAEHEEAYTAYAARFGTDQSAARLAERGGFGYRELQDFLGHDPTTWMAQGAR